MNGKKPSDKKSAYQKRLETAVDKNSGRHLEINDYPTIWLAVGLPNGSGDTCACGKKHIKYVFRVENIRNGKSLNVGSTCVKHFGLKTLTDDAVDSLDNIKNNRGNGPSIALLHFLVGSNLMTNKQAKTIKWAKKTKKYDMIACLNKLIVDHSLTRKPKICCAKRMLPELTWFDAFTSPRPPVKYVCQVCSSNVLVPL